MKLYLNYADGTFSLNAVSNNGVSCNSMYHFMDSAYSGFKCHIGDFRISNALEVLQDAEFIELHDLSETTVDEDAAALEALLDGLSDYFKIPA